MKPAFALYVALTWMIEPQGVHVLDLHKTYETEEACVNACLALEHRGSFPTSLKGGSGRQKAVADYFCIVAPGE